MRGKLSVVVAIVVWASLAICGCGIERTQIPAWPRLSSRELSPARAIGGGAFAKSTRTPEFAFRQVLTISIRDDLSGRGFDGRGVVVVKPHTALRMILLGPGGTTAMDVWMVRDRWRVAIPALDRVVVGDRHSPPERLRGLPVVFLWRWLVDPWGGSLIAARAGSPHRLAPSEEKDAFRNHRSNLVAWLHRGHGGVEIRDRAVDNVGVRARAWWFHRGALTGYLEGVEEPLVTSPQGALFAIRATYVAFDPAMTVRVHGETPVAVAEGDLPPSTFLEPPSHLASNR